MEYLCTFRELLREDICLKVDSAVISIVRMFSFIFIFILVHLDGGPFQSYLQGRVTEITTPARKNGRKIKQIRNRIGGRNFCGTCRTPGPRCCGNEGDAGKMNFGFDFGGVVARVVTVQRAFAVVVINDTRVA